MNYKYKVGAGFPANCWEKVKHKVKFSRKRKQACNLPGIRSSSANQKNADKQAVRGFCFVFTAPRCVMTIHPLQVKEKLYLACKMWDQERETNTSLCRRANPAHMQWFWKNPLESISQMSLMFSKQYQSKGDKGPALWPARHVVALLSQSERVWRTPLASHRPDTVLLLGLSITYRRTATSQKGYMTFYVFFRPLPSGVTSISLFA